jgi:hypothetical protein
VRAHHFAALIALGAAAPLVAGCPSSSNENKPKPAPQVSVQVDGAAAPVLATCQNLCDKAMKCMNKQEPGRAESCIAKCENGGRYQAQLRAKMMQMDCAELSAWLSD